MAGIIVASYTIGSVNLTSAEKTEIAAACFKCHRNPEHLSHNAGKVHQNHTNAECMTCHLHSDGLEAADNAHDALEWAGIGITIATVAGLGTNYFVTRKRLANPDS